MRYTRITLDDGQRFIVRVTRETAEFISGIEVNTDGDEVVPPGHHNRLRIIERARIRTITEMRMNNTYATLEAVR